MYSCVDGKRRSHSPLVRVNVQVLRASASLLLARKDDILIDRKREAEPLCQWP